MTKNFRESYVLNAAKALLNDADYKKYEFYVTEGKRVCFFAFQYLENIPIAELKKMINSISEVKQENGAEESSVKIVVVKSEINSPAASTVSQAEASINDQQSDNVTMEINNNTHAKQSSSSQVLNPASFFAAQAEEPATISPKQRKSRPTRRTQPPKSDKITTKKLSSSTHLTSRRHEEADTNSLETTKFALEVCEHHADRFLRNKFSIQVPQTMLEVYNEYSQHEKDSQMILSFSSFNQLTQKSMPNVIFKNEPTVPDEFDDMAMNASKWCPKWQQYNIQWESFHERFMSHT